jgi:hypothetical protein
MTSWKGRRLERKNMDGRSKGKEEQLGRRTENEEE